MAKAKISKMFLSIQGEGLYFGIPQFFVRFFGCNLLCDFCDTRPEFYTYVTERAMLNEIKKCGGPFHSLSLTGGEPLLQVEFIRKLVKRFKKGYKKPVYLDTNGVLHDELNDIIEIVDIVAMDFKLPSSTKDRNFSNEHERFLNVAKKKDVFIKAVITPGTVPRDILEMRKIVENIDPDIPIVLQPVTDERYEEPMRPESIDHFRILLRESIKRVEVIPQIHKLIGVE
jgi:7-carboxy-7-deazaguanine synthase